MINLTTCLKHLQAKVGNSPGSDGYPPKLDEEWSNPASSSDGGDGDYLVGEQRSPLFFPPPFWSSPSLVAIVVVLFVISFIVSLVWIVSLTYLVWIVIRKCLEQSDEGTSSESSPA